MQCRVCESKTVKTFNSLVLHKYSVDYFRCPNCSFLQTEQPYWLNEAYDNSINISDTGLLDRNISFSKMLAVLIYFNFNKDAKFLDYAGGYGVFTRLMRDIGFDFYWNDPYTQNLLAKGFKADINIDLKYELVTAFEVFEHLVNPKDEIEKMLQLSDTIVFSTEILPDPMPEAGSWWYHGFEHGQHISFYSRITLMELAKHFKLNYYFLESFHLFSRKIFDYKKLLIMKKFRNYGLFQIVKKMMKSKTMTDYYLLTNNKKNAKEF